MSINAMQFGATSFRNLFVRAVDQAPPATVPQCILDWMARLMLLENVPFEYLVSNRAMLPSESIRFFTIDSNWLFRAVEGAASAGTSSSRDVLQTLTMVDQLAQKAAANASAIRTQDRLKSGAASTPASTVPVSSGTWSGFLLRSRAVEGWPGVEVTASDSNGNQLPLLRMDRLSPTVLLCLFKGIATKASLMEPPETLHFGIFRDDKNNPYVVLRGLGFSGQNPGMPLSGSPQAAVAMRASTTFPGVVDTAGTAANLVTALKAKQSLSPQNIFTSAEYAIEMVRAAGVQSFVRSDQ
jgi:hypothetical protein